MAVTPSASTASFGSRPLRVAAVGVSTSEICGVRDYATVLADALEREGVSCSLHWLLRSGGSIMADRAQVRDWTHALQSELGALAPDAVLLHYSVFAYSHRGIPLFVGPVLAGVRGARAPVVTVLHEAVFPWKLAGLKGKLWSASHRLRLIGVLNASAAILVTTDPRAAWLRSRRWLPRRRVAVAPVFSNLPPARPQSSADRERPPAGEGGLVGLFGYSYDTATVSLVLDALRVLHDRGLTVRLALLGAPGARSAAGERWLGLAREREIDGTLVFSGALPAQELADRLAACDVLLFADPIGPTSRKTTLAASLASGRAVVALDGPQRWPEVIEQQAARVVTPTAQALADALAQLLLDRRSRESLAAGAREFSERTGLAHSARVVAGLVADVAGQADQAGTRSRSHAERAL